VLIEINPETGEQELETGDEFVESRRVEDPRGIPADERDNAHPLEGAVGTADRLERQPEVVGRIGAAHWNVDRRSRNAVRGGLEEVKEHRHSAYRIAPADDDRLSERRAQLVGDLAKKLKLQIWIGPEHPRERVDWYAIQRHLGNRLRGVQVVAAFGKPEQVVTEQERQDAPFTAWKIAKGLECSLCDDEHAMTARVLPVHDPPGRQVHFGGDAGQLRLLTVRQEPHDVIAVRTNPGRSQGWSAACHHLL
jgi:hypothetical protein